MSESVSREIVVEGVDPRELYGAQNIYLDQIKSLHPDLKVIARGSSLKVLGSEQATEQFAKRIEGLVSYYLKYGHISQEVVEQCVCTGNSSEQVRVDNDEIVYGNGVNSKSAKAVDQQRLGEG